MAASERDGRTRGTEAVLRDHLELARRGEIEADIARNYAADVVLLTRDGVLRGAEGIRHSARLLAEHMGTGTFSYDAVRVADEYALLEWSAEGDRGRISDGSDSFHVRDGRIVMQSIDYRERQV